MKRIVVVIIGDGVLSAQIFSAIVGVTVVVVVLTEELSLCGDKNKT